MEKILLITVALFSIFSFAGPRVVGNGGDIVPSFSINQQDLITAIEEAKPALRFWLYRQETRLLQQSEENIRRSPPTYGVAKLFPKGLYQTRIYDFLDTTNIVIYTQASCIAKGEYRDGFSFLYGHGSWGVPPTICLSGHSLLQKLNFYDFRVQVEGLILHELSHLVGNDEAEAVSLQKKYIETMRDVSPTTIYYEVLHKLSLLEDVSFQKDSEKTTAFLSSNLQNSLLPSPFQIFSHGDLESIQSSIIKRHMDEGLIQTLKEHLRRDLQKFDVIILSK